MENISLGIIGGTGRLGSLIQKHHSCSFIIHSKTKLEEIPFESIDVFIDVSINEAIHKYLDSIVQAQKPLVCGSTQYSGATEKKLSSLQDQIPIVIASNFSKGIYHLKQLLQSFDQVPKIIRDIHHIHKKDAPSGTAKSLENLYEPSIPIKSIREGEVSGTHEVVFQFNEEEITITHTALSRDLFAFGAIEAATFLSKKKPGLYTMHDVYSKQREESYG